MPDTRTRSKVRLGAYLKALREKAGFKTEEAGAAVRVTRQTINRAESGHNRPGFPLLRSLLDQYGADGTQRAKAELLWEAARYEPKTIEHSSGMPTKYRAYLRDEAEATWLKVWEQTIVPGLLQVPEYIEALTVESRIFIRSDSDAQSAARSRLSRQDRVRGANPLTLHFLIDEAVIRRVVGGPDVMIKQLRHLLDVMTFPNVTLQVIPFGMGAYGVMSGAVTILGWADRDERDMAYLEYPLGGESVEDDDDVTKFGMAFESAAAKALSVEQSATLIREALRIHEQST